MTPIRKTALRALLSSAIAFSAAAGNALAAGDQPSASPANDTLFPADAAQAHPAQALVEQAVSDMIDALKANRDALKKDPALLDQLLQQHVTKHFDMPGMAQSVLAVHWRRANDQQKERFTNAFSTMLMRTYAAALLSYSDQKIDILPVRTTPGSDKVTVSTTIEQPGGPDISIDYRLSRDSNNQWKVYDLSIEGVSMVTTYRGQYGPLARRSGIDGLLQRIEDFNQKNAPKLDGPNL
ncbi:MAG: ABC transporter substrate-binding protein [Rhodospirillales bacterium]|nr:ABC transporter substrate-binding protein [Rhodospirillales bacterium]MCB9997076.1 ABC transporter substrate-binding protein [Rhodospirillales bacterium]